MAPLGPSHASRELMHASREQLMHGGVSARQSAMTLARDAYALFHTADVIDY